MKPTKETSSNPLAKTKNCLTTSINNPVKLTYTSTLDGKTYTLSTKQKAFCENYILLNGNGTQALYKAGYKANTEASARAIASEYLTKPNVYGYINELLTENGLNDTNVKKQHLFLLNQHKDLNVKNKAIDMFYKLQGNYAPEKKLSVNVEIKGGKGDELADEYEDKLRKKLLES